jgi:hypothetical protein
MAMGPVSWAMPDCDADFDIIDGSRQVFGDDGILTFAIRYKRDPSTAEEARAGTVLQHIVSSVIRSCGFGVSMADVYLSKFHSEFLNWHIYGMLSRRSRVYLEREKGSGGAADEMAVAAMGPIVSGESIETYTRGIVRIMVSKHEEAIFGNKMRIGIDALMRPSIKGNFITALPFPCPPFPLYSARPGLLPQVMAVQKTTFHANEDTLAHDVGKAMQEKFPRVRIRVGGAQKGVFAVTEALKQSKAALINRERVFVDKDFSHEDQLRYGYEYSPERALTMELGRATLKDAHMGKKIRAATRTTGESAKERVALQTKFDFGFDSTFSLLPVPVGFFQTTGKGRVGYFELHGTRAALLKEFPLVQPVFGGCFVEGLMLQSVFKLSANPSPELASEFSTGEFSLHKIQGSQTLAEIRSIDPNMGPETARLIMKRQGFDDAAIASRIARLAFIDFSFQSEIVEKWKSARLTEMHFSAERISAVFGPQLRAGLMRIADRDRAFTGHLREIVEMILMSVTVNDSLVAVCGWRDQRKRKGLSSNFSDFWNTSGIRLGSIYPISFGVRMRA